MPSSSTLTQQQAATETVEALQLVRDRTLRLINQLDTVELESVHSTLMSPLVWDLGHIAAFEDLWISHRYGKQPLLRPDLAEIYDAFETPRVKRGDIAFLKAKECFHYLAEVRQRSVEITNTLGVSEVHELVIRHELQHSETMLQTMELASLPFAIENPATATQTDDQPILGLELLEVPTGDFVVGANSDGFAYDNERPAHSVELKAFLIGRGPVTNGEFREFVDAGGYQRREWWSDAGWQWRLETGSEHPQHWQEDLTVVGINGQRALIDEEPAVHINWFEADAFARSHGLRLPTEFEWEKAARFDATSGESVTTLWNEKTFRREFANLDPQDAHPIPVHCYEEGRSPSGCYGMIGGVWEWTASEFDGYPGFNAYPYPEYSEVFFKQGYRSLRGGSWATSPRVVSASFRNWDLPQRSQIFSGFRVAKTV